MSHSNFGVFEMDDPLDDLAYETIHNLKNPPRVPHEAPSLKFHSRLNAKDRTKGYPLSDTEDFVAE